MPIANLRHLFSRRTLLPALFCLTISGCAHQNGQKSLAPGPDDSNRLPGIIVSGHSRSFHPQQKVESSPQIYSSPPKTAPVQVAKTTRPVPRPTRSAPAKKLLLQKDIYFSFNSKRFPMPISLFFMPTQGFCAKTPVWPFVSMDTPIRSEAASSTINGGWNGHWPPEECSLPQGFRPNVFLFSRKERSCLRDSPNVKNPIRFATPGTEPCGLKW
jgi:hypothetical protein